MAVNLKGRSFLTLMDLRPEEIRYLLDLAKELKAKSKMGIFNQLLKGKNICLLFEKTSTRTRCAFEVACHQEGGNVTFLDSKSSQMGKKESLEDTAKVLGRFYDGIEYRGYDQSVVESLAKHSGVPVCGDVRNNMSYAWMQGCAKMGMHFVAYGPEELVKQVDNEILKEVNAVAEKTGAIIEISSEESCLKGADVIYTDIWASMGEEDKIPERVKLLTPYRVDCELMKKTGNKDVIFMHCLPSFHDFETTLAKEQKEKGYDIREVTDDVFNAGYSKVFDEAENRMHTIKAVIISTMA